MLDITTAVDRRDDDLLLLAFSRSKVEDLENIMRSELEDEGAEPDDAQRRREIHAALNDVVTGTRRQPLMMLLAAAFAAEGFADGWAAVAQVAQALDDSVDHHEYKSEAFIDDYSDEDLARMAAADDLSRRLAAAIAGPPLDDDTPRARYLSAVRCAKQHGGNTPPAQYLAAARRAQAHYDATPLKLAFTGTELAHVDTDELEHLMEVLVDERPARRDDLHSLDQGTSMATFLRLACEKKVLKLPAGVTFDAEGADDEDGSRLRIDLSVAGQPWAISAGWREIRTYWPASDAALTDEGHVRAALDAAVGEINTILLACGSPLTPQA
jgi:hypothetical protein